MLEPSLLVAMAFIVGSPASIYEGSEIRPPPPAIESISPAKKTRGQTIKKGTIPIDEKISAPIICGKQYGKVEYYIGETLLETVPLVADRSISEGNIFVKLYGKIYNLF